MTKSIELNGVSLACIDALPPGIYLDLVEGFKGNIVVASIKFLQGVVIPEDRAKLDAVLYNTENVCPWPELSDVATKVLQEYSGRPTERPSDSPTGSESTGQTTRVVSFSRGTVEEEAIPSEDGQSPEFSASPM